MKYSLTMHDLTAEQVVELLSKNAGKVAKAKVIEEDFVDEDDVDEDDEAPKKKAKAKKKPVVDEDEDGDDSDDENEDDEDEPADEDDDGPTLAQMISEFQKFSKREGMPAAKKVLQAFKAKRVQDLDQKIYTKVLAKLKAK